jgi:four helix bundle protein
MRDYTKYEVWQDSIKLCKLIYSSTLHFPSDEKFGITLQMRRAAVSIASNIAEGASRASEKDFARSIEIAIGSSYEVSTQTLIAKELGYLPENEFEKIDHSLISISKQLSGLYKLLKSKK